ncbi:MAG TPA: hypothetical protein VGW98_10290 [Solirubrobacteraceae bacterium]|jgi:hypothetical protein|nr:hypothetical protein [Solirubrobacteraceae bacterium]
MRVPTRSALKLAGLSLAMLLPLGGAAQATPLAMTHFSLQTTRTVEEAGTRERLENGKREGSDVFSPEAFGFRTEPYSYVQAGGHPEGLTFTLELESEEVDTPSGPGPVPTRDPKDIASLLPAGLLGNPTAVKRCPLAIALSSEHCPADTQVGVAVISLGHGEGRVAPIVNVVPEAGQSAEFVIETIDNIHFVLTAHLVHTPEGYGVVVESNGVPNLQITRVETTFWGDPAAHSHDVERGLMCERRNGHGDPWKCGATGVTGRYGFGLEPSGEPELPFLIMPTDCSLGGENAAVRADSWQEPGSFAEAQFAMPAVTGCDLVQFVAGTGIALRPDTLLADAPVGAEVDLSIPQPQDPLRPAAPQLRETRVTLPQGMSVSSGVVDGIQACEATGPHGIDIPTGRNASGEPLRPGEPGEGEELGVNGEPTLAAGHCPAASTVGEAEAVTPLLPAPVKGHVYLARPECGGPGEHACTDQDALDGKLFKLYLELGGTGEFADTGINFKVPFDVQANPATGQLTSVVQNIAQAPVSEVKIRLNGGPRASLDNPPQCGPAVTTADFSPWSAPGVSPEGLFSTGTPDASVSSYFNVEGCSNPPPFNPSFLAGTVTPGAGSFSGFTVNIARNDREQFVKGVQVHTPPGLLGMLSSVPLCGEPAADQGTCPQSSRIGTTRVATGAGSHPFEVQGDVYLTGPYQGAPFGLSVVTHAVAGPFNLGLVVVRARIVVDPTDSSLTVTTDESGPYALPQIIFGVPLRLKRITVDIDRPGFMFNPTSCAARQVTARISGSGQAVANVQSPFAVGGCRSLAFNPQFTVSTNGHTSKQAGASLDAKVTYPPGSTGTAANIAYAKVELPKQLPSRLTTLQKACLAATFEANPANCPPGSVIGVVRTKTPVLPVELSGPVYFVSHGGEAFPSLVAVLQGDGVRVDLTGETFIDKHGVTSSTFKTVPDVPVSSFELYLPEGPYSALAANTNLCSFTTTVAVKHKITTKVHGRTVHRTITTHVTKPATLTMPTEFVGQNGAVLKQSTPITVTGCTTAKAKARTARKAKRGRTARR